ncbi:MAG TPA: FG-GAP repeat protein, partial [Thermoanaerobaculia bacterium]|nr:FG-GAP repeat protein [Thermoanaerobaculia bacterium]
LAAGNFDGDPFDDLAVGIPADSATKKGAVRVFYGAIDGLSSDRYESLDEDAAGGAEHVCTNNFFGFELARGNFDGDLYDDLAIGVPTGCEWNPDLQAHVRGGSLYVAHGSAAGLLPFLGYRISQDSYGIYDDVEAGDQFGAALSAGDFNADGYQDLAVGVPQENTYSGAIEIIMGSQYGLIFANSAFWLPGALGEVPEFGDLLGSTLAAGDFDGDGFDDLVVGTPLEDLGPEEGSPDAGSVDIAYGAADPYWFDLSRTDHLTQSSIHGAVAHDGYDDRFGSSFAVADFDLDGRDDLAIGSPRDDWSGSDLGAVTILMGDLPPLGSSSRHHLVAIGWEGVPGNASQPSQSSGWALAAGNFDGAGRPDLAIGVPFYDNGASANAGAEAVLYGDPKLFIDGFESGASDRWSSVSN